MNNLQLWISALEISGFFSLMGLSYLLIRLGTDFFNFALGAYAMVAALSTTYLVRIAGLGLWLAVLISVAIAVALGVLTEVGLVRLVQKRAANEELPALIAVAALLFLIAQVSGDVFGRAPAPGQKLIGGDPMIVFGAILTPTAALIIALTAACFVTVTLWMKFSTTGRLLRAVGDNREAAQTLGFPVNRVRLFAFVIGTIIAAFGGLAFASKSGVAFNSALDWTLLGFLALVFGGTGRVWAPLVGGLILGMLQMFLPYYFPHFSPTIGIFLVALVLFSVRPQGLFVRKVRA